MGIGTAPGALLVGAGLAARNYGSVPVASLAVGMALLAVIVWLQGSMGLQPPHGEAANLTEISRRYFTPVMHRIIGAMIGIGMTGWFGVNVGMGAGSLRALTGLPQWAAASLIGIPILLLSLRGMRTWNRLAAVTTVCVLGLVAWVMVNYSPGGLPVAAASPSPSLVAVDVAVLIGYIGVFTVRAPDFTAGLAGLRDLNIVALLLLAPMILVVLAGAILAREAGSSDLVRALAGPGGLAVGNLLIALAVVAPTFTTLYSGAPALRAGFSISERTSLYTVALVGLALAIARFDLWLIPWLSILGAMLPPIVVPLLAEFVSRRIGRSPRAVPLWPWLGGALVAFALAIIRHPLAMTGGFLAAGAATALWQSQGGRLDRAVNTQGDA
jgi:cytosine permease